MRSGWPVPSGPGAAPAVDATPRSTALLELAGVNAYYGPSHVLFGVSLTVNAGEVVGLLGRNGAGKSTTMKTIMGLLGRWTGSIRFRGHELRGWEPYRVCRLGVGYVPEERRIFGGLTVEENLDAGRRRRRGTEPWDEARIFALFPQLAAMAHRRAGSLSGGEQQMLAIARTLMGNPELVLLDEPSEGLAPLVVHTLQEQLHVLKRSGTTILLSEQNLKFSTRIADRLYVIEKGEVKYTGTPEELAARDDIRKTYLML